MVDKKKIIYLLNEKFNLDVDESNLLSESYILYTDELDINLLPTNFYDILPSTSYLVFFFYYEDIIIYIFYNPSMTKKFLTGILKNKRLVYSYYE